MTAAVPAGGPWFPGSPCDPGCLPPPPADAGVARVLRWSRTVVRIVGIATVIAGGALLALAAPAFGRERLARVQGRWAGLLLAVAGVRVALTGPRPAPGSLVVANHVSWLDVLVLYRVAPVRMLAKTEVRDWPVVGAMATRAGSVFIDRDRLRALPGSVAAVAGALRSGAGIAVFPEGTTGCGRELGPFRPAALQAALDARAPIVPVALAYTDLAGRPDASAAFVGDDTLVASLLRVAGARRTVVTVRVLSALAPDDAAVTGAGCAGPRREAARRGAAAIAAALPPTAADPRPRVTAHPVPRVAPAARGQAVPAGVVRRAA